MINIEQQKLILEALPDPAFILSRGGKYVWTYGGRDARYYHESTALIGTYISDVINPDKAAWFLEHIAIALETRQLLIVEYELSGKDVKGLNDDGPKDPIWFEGRIQALDFQVDNEEVVLWVASNISKRHHLEDQLRKLSDTDQLTDLFNRRKLEHDMLYHRAVWIRHALPTCVFMFVLRKSISTASSYAQPPSPN